MRDIVLVNTNAATLRHHPDLAKEIEALCPRALVIANQPMPIARAKIIRECYGGKRRLFIVGGDGTFRFVLECLAELPPERYPVVVPVGGGQFNYMARFCGYDRNDPLRNLKGILAGVYEMFERQWRPVVIEDTVAQHTYYAALFADGVVSQFIDRYEREGKGSMAAVLRILWSAVCDIVRGFGAPRRDFAPVQGRLFINRCGVTDSYVGILVGAIDRLIPGCTPFAGTPTEKECYCVGYWGGYFALAAKLPFFWTGWMPGLLYRKMHNAPVHEVMIDTHQPAIVLDGDLVPLPQPTTLVISRSPEPIQLLCMRPPA